MTKFYPKKFVLTLICFLGIVLFLFVITTFGINENVPSVDKNSLDLWYVRSPTEELLCWGNNDHNICGWSWTYTAPLDKTIITNAGMLQKAYPSKVVQKQKIAVLKNENFYSPINSFFITGDYVYFITPGANLSRWNKKNHNIQDIYSARDLSAVASVEPGDGHILIANEYYGVKSYSIVNPYNKNVLSLGLVDTFSWTNDGHYLAGMVDDCRPHEIKNYRCGVNFDLLNCPAYPHQSSDLIQRMSNPYELSDYVLNIANGWQTVIGGETSDPNLYKTIYKNSQNKPLVTYTFEPSQVCDNVETGMYAGRNVDTLTIDNYPAFLTVYKQPVKTTTNGFILAKAQVHTNNRFYNFLLTTSDLNKKPYQSQAINEFQNMLQTIRFNTSSP